MLIRRVSISMVKTSIRWTLALGAISGGIVGWQVAMLHAGNQQALELAADVHRAPAEPTISKSDPTIVNAVEGRQFFPSLVPESDHAVHATEAVAPDGKPLMTPNIAQGEVDFTVTAAAITGQSQIRLTPTVAAIIPQPAKTDSTLAPVPEPATAGLLAIGVVGLLGRRRV